MDEARSKPVLPSASNQKPPLFRQQPDQFATCELSCNQLNVDNVEALPRPSVKVYLVGNESHSFLEQLIGSSVHASDQFESNESRQGKLASEAGAGAEGTSDSVVDTPAVERSQKHFASPSGNVCVRAWLSEHPEALGFQCWGFRGKETLHELLFTTNALFVVVLELDQPQKELQEEAGYWLDLIAKSAPGAATFLVAKDVVGVEASTLKAGFCSLDGFVVSRGLHQLSMQRGIDPDGSSEGDCMLSASVLRSEPGMTRESYLQLVGGKIKEAAVKDRALQQECLEAGTLISEEDKEKLVTAESLRRLLTDAKTFPLQSTRSRQDPSGHAVKQMQIKFKKQGILHSDLLRLMIRASKTEEAGHAEQLIRVLNKAKLAYQPRNNPGQVQWRPSEHIIPSSWSPPDERALERLWPLPLAKAIPREFVLGWYFHFDKYDVPREFVEHPVGQCLQHNGHNNDCSRVLFWPRGATLYRNKVQVFMHMVEREGDNSPYLLLLGRLVRKECTEVQLEEGAALRAIWTELAHYFSEVSRLLNCEFADYPVRIEALCPESAFMPREPKLGQTASVLECVQSQLHSVPYPGALDGCIPLHDLRTHGCNGLTSVPCEFCGACLDPDLLAPPKSTLLPRPEVGAQTVLTSSGHCSDPLQSTGRNAPSPSPGTPILCNENSGSSSDWSDRSSTLSGLHEGALGESPRTPNGRRPCPFMSSLSDYFGQGSPCGSLSGGSRPATPGEEAPALERRAADNRCPVSTLVSTLAGRTTYRDVLSLSDEKKAKRNGLANILEPETTYLGRPVGLAPRVPTYVEAVQGKREPPRSVPEDIPNGQGALGNPVDYPAVRTPRMDRGLVKRWEFNEKDTVRDHDSIFGGAIIQKDRLALVRAEGRLTCPIPRGQVTSSMSFEVAVQLSDEGDTSVLMTVRRNGFRPGAFVSLLLEASHWAVETSNLDGVPKCFDDSPEEDTCQPLHLVMVVKVRKKTCTVECYRNGKLLGWPVMLQAEAFGPNSNRQLVLGDSKEKDFAPTDIYFARLYNKELDKDDVERLYRAFKEEIL